MNLANLADGSRCGMSRRRFLEVCTAAAAAVGLPASAAEKMAEKVASGKKPSVIWLHFQECTGCTESLLRTSHPDVAELILDLVSLDYHETLFAAAGRQIEDALDQAVKAHSGKYILVVEGAVPLKDGGIYCQVAGANAVDILRSTARTAGALVAIGSCASWGGLASSSPNPTGATGVPEVLKGAKVVTLPGCPANPYNLLGVVLQYATFGTLPALDEKGRPRFAYARVIHDDCPRRTHFDAGRFAQKYGDEGHRHGHCLYRLGCKGPRTHANCSLLSFAEVPGAWPIGVGHPCYGCTEKGIGFEMPLHATVEIGDLGPPATYPSVAVPRAGVNPVAVGVGGAVVGALAGGAYMASRKIGLAEEKEKEKEKKP